MCAVGVQGVERVEEGGEDYADGYGEEGEGGFALLEVSLWGGAKEGGGTYLGPLALVLEGDWVGGEEEVEGAVGEADVPGQMRKM